MKITYKQVPNGFALILDGTVWAIRPTLSQLVAIANDVYTYYGGAK